MIELSRTQDEEVGDGTTSVIILAGEILARSLPLLERNIHPVVIIRAFSRALEDALEVIASISQPVDTSSEEEMMALVKTSIGTKFSSRWSDLMCSLALQAVRTVAVTAEEESPFKAGAGAVRTVDLKRYARVEKVPGGEIEESRVLTGVMVNKDITHPKMRRRIQRPRIILLDCPLEYKKGESQTNIEVTREEDWNRFLQIEEEQIRSMCDRIIELKPDVVFTEKGVSDLAQHFLLKADPPITAIRRVRKSDNNRIARAVGATIVNRVDDLRDTDVGTQCGLFHVEKLGDEYFTFLDECDSPRACTILLRGPSKDILNEIDRNLADAMAVARNVVFNPTLAPGGGATEMAISVALAAKAKALEGVEGAPYRAVAEALEVIPRTLVQNCGGNAIRTLTELRAKHANGEHRFGVDGDTGKVTDMKTYGLYESASVKIQTLKTAIEVSLTCETVFRGGQVANIRLLLPHLFIIAVRQAVAPRRRHCQRTEARRGRRCWWRRWWRPDHGRRGRTWGDARDVAEEAKTRVEKTRDRRTLNGHQIAMQSFSGIVPPASHFHCCKRCRGFRLKSGYVVQRLDHLARHLSICGRPSPCQVVDLPSPQHEGAPGIGSGIFWPPFLAALAPRKPRNFCDIYELGVDISVQCREKRSSIMTRFAPDFQKMGSKRGRAKGLSWKYKGIINEHRGSSFDHISTASQIISRDQQIIKRNRR